MSSANGMISVGFNSCLMCWETGGSKYAAYSSFPRVNWDAIPPIPVWQYRRVLSNCNR